MFLPTLAKEAISKKYCGNARAVISIQRAMLSVKIDMNLNFFISASKFFPYLEANIIAPN
jgi:hypothetical protein